MLNLFQDPSGQVYTLLPNLASGMLKQVQHDDWSHTKKAAS
jgi:hypothetical protein